MFRGRYVVNSVVPNAAGIRKGDPVTMLGVSIGRVQKFDIAPSGVQVRLEIEGEYSIPTDSNVLRCISNSVLDQIHSADFRRRILLELSCFSTNGNQFCTSTVPPIGREDLWSSNEW